MGRAGVYTSNTVALFHCFQARGLLVSMVTLVHMSAKQYIDVFDIIMKLVFYTFTLLYVYNCQTHTLLSLQISHFLQCCY